MSSARRALGAFASAHSTVPYLVHASGLGGFEHVAEGGRGGEGEVEEDATMRTSDKALFMGVPTSSRQQEKGWGTQRG